MKISIITITYNSAETIEDTIKSVANQNYDKIEHIIVDGKSKDNTLEIVSKYKDKISKIVSEPDEGLYYALNKGIDLATGDIVGILHSDDIFASNTVVAEIAELFKNNSTTEAVYADLNFVDRFDTNKVVRKWKSHTYHDGDFKKGWMPPHPTFYVKNNVYEKFGKFNTDFKFSADYELMLRLIHKHKINVAYLPKVTIKMRMGGVSNTNISNKIKANLEDRKAWKVNGLEAAWYTAFIKPLSKAAQYMQKEKS